MKQCSAVAVFAQAITSAQCRFHGKSFLQGSDAKLRNLCTLLYKPNTDCVPTLMLMVTS
jgi:hypothetical protein